MANSMSPLTATQSQCVGSSIGEQAKGFGSMLLEAALLGLPALHSRPLDSPMNRDSDVGDFARGLRHLNRHQLEKLPKAPFLVSP